MMMVTRDVDAEFVNLQRQGQLALFPSCCGQEAAQVGTASATSRHRLAVSPVPGAGRVRRAGHRPGGRRAQWRGTAMAGWFHRTVLRADLDPDRHPHAARRRLRPWLPERHGEDRGRRRPSSATAPRARVTFTRRSTWPRCSRCRASSSCRTTSGRSRFRSRPRPG